MLSKRQSGKTNSVYIDCLITEAARIDFYALSIFSLEVRGLSRKPDNCGKALDIARLARDMLGRAQTDIPAFCK